MLDFHVISVGMFQSNCVLVRCRRTSVGILVDAGDDAERILDLVEATKTRVTAVVTTHGHLDHVAALAEVTSALSVPAWIHRADIPTYDMLEMQAAMFGLAAPRRIHFDRRLDDGDTFAVGEATAECLHAPGHSPGGVCLWFGAEQVPHVVSGDVLFAGSIGRTDLPGGDHGVMMQTLKRVFVPMPDNTVVIPGHGPKTTIGQEKLANPFLAPLAGQM